MQGAFQARTRGPDQWEEPMKPERANAFFCRRDWSVRWLMCRDENAALLSGSNDSVIFIRPSLDWNKRLDLWAYSTAGSVAIRTQHLHIRVPSAAARILRGSPVASLNIWCDRGVCFPGPFPRGKSFECFSLQIERPYQSGLWWPHDHEFRRCKFSTACRTHVSDSSLRYDTNRMHLFTCPCTASRPNL